METGQIAIFLAEHFVITVRYGPLGDITGIRRRLNPTPISWRSVQPPWPTRSWMRPSMGTWPSPRKSHATSRSSRSPCSARGADQRCRDDLPDQARELEMRRAVSPLVAFSHALVRDSVRVFQKSCIPISGISATICCAWLSTPKATINC